MSKDTRKADRIASRRKKPSIVTDAAGGISIYVPPAPEAGALSASAENVVDVTELNQVISEWGREVVQPLVTKNPTAPPVEPPVPPTTGLQDIPPILLGTSPLVLTNKRITGDIPIEGPLGKSVDVAIQDCELNGGQYGAIISSGRLNVFRTPIRVTGSGDNCYLVRLWGDGRPFKMIGNPAAYTVGNNRPAFKKLLRLSNFLGGEIAYYKFIGSGSWIGTGPADHNGPPDCGPLWIHDCDWYTVAGEMPHALEYFENTHNITVERVNFYLAPGYGVLNAWTDKPNCRGHRFIGCTVTPINASTLQPTGPAVPLGWQHIRGGAAKNAIGITITP